MSICEMNSELYSTHVSTLKILVFCMEDMPCQTKMNTTAEFLFQVHSFNKDNSMLKASRKFTDKVLVFDLIAFWKSIGPMPKGTLDHIQKRFDHICQTNIFEWCGKKYPQALRNQVKTLK